MRDSCGRTIDYLRLSVTDLCNYRCQYCMPPEGVEKRLHSDILSIEELAEIAAAAVRCGVKKIRLTGGEPLVRRGLPDLCRMLRAIPGLAELCLTTNGSLLPQLARPLRDAGVDRLNISLDTLRPDRFAAMTRLGTLQDVLAGIKAAEAAGFRNLKFDTVLIGGFNDDEIEDFVNLSREHPWEMRFIELMPMGPCAGWDRSRFLPAETVLERMAEGETNEAQGGGAPARRAGDSGAHLPSEPRLLRGLPPDSGDGGRQAEGLPPQPGRDPPPGPPRPGAGGRRPAGHPPQAGAPPSHRTVQRHAPKHESDRRMTTMAELTHFNEQGRARMVDVTEKAVTHRRAVAAGEIHMAPETLQNIKDGTLKKGDVLAVAQVAGIQAAKHNWELIPMCHPLPLTGIDITFALSDSPCMVEIQAAVTCTGVTGVEMEALTAVSVAALTIYDMCKAVQKDMRIENIRLLSKSGGKSGDYQIKE